MLTPKQESSLAFLTPALAWLLLAAACSSTDANSSAGTAGYPPPSSAAGASHAGGAGGALAGVAGSPGVAGASAGGTQAGAGAGEGPHEGGRSNGGSGGVSANANGGLAGFLAAAGTGDASAGQAAFGGSGGAPKHQELVLYDDAGGRLLYVNNAKPSANWTANSGGGRDLQLIGGGRVMLGKSDGWDEYQLSDGAKVGGRHGFASTQTAHRMASGDTILASVASGSIVLKMVSPSGSVARQVSYAGFSYVRMVRPTAAGTFLIAADTVAFEGDDQGQVTWKVDVAGGRHVWKAMRLANGNTAVSNGYGAALLVYDGAGKLLQTIGGKNQPNASAIAPWFYADFHVMPTGNFFVVNSQADRTMDASVQLLEYDSAGTLVWQQKQPAGVHSLEEAIVLDGLDLSKLQVEPQGQLIAAP